MNKNLKYISHSKKGYLREKNQDRILIIENQDFYFFSIFDGVSSFNDSYKFIEIFKRKIRLRINTLDKYGNDLDKFLFNINVEVLKDGIRGASTISAIFISKNKSISKYVNIGDSRIYVFSNQFLEPITKDDSLENGSNILTKCLGSNELILNDFHTAELNNSYNYLLCTDGFHCLMESKIKDYFKTLNFKKVKSIKSKISTLQRKLNKDDSSYIIIKQNEV